MIDSILQYQFLQNAFLAAVFSSILCGLIGTIVVEKKMVMMGGGMAHASFGGIGLGYFLGIEPIITALGFSTCSGLIMVRLKERGKANLDTLIGIFWALGMAMGILLVSIMPGYPPDMSSYLFGDILTVSRFYIFLMMGISLFLVVLLSVWYPYWLLYLFDEEFAKVQKVKVKFLENLLFILIACSIVVLLKVVGMILVVALLTIPTAIAKFFSKSLKQLFLYSVFLSFLLCIGGLILSYQFNIPSGATIILLAAGVYFIQSIFLRIQSKISFGNEK